MRASALTEVCDCLWRTSPIMLLQGNLLLRSMRRLWLASNLLSVLALRAVTLLPSVSAALGPSSQVKPLQTFRSLTFIPYVLVKGDRREEVVLFCFLQLAGQLLLPDVSNVALLEGGEVLGGVEGHDQLA